MKADAVPISEVESESRSTRILPYLEKFKHWALAKAKSSGIRSGEFINSEALREWDRTHNYRRIEKSFGTDADIREAGIRALYSRVLGSYLQLDAFSAPVNAVSTETSYELKVEMSTVIRGIYIPEASETEREILIKEQEDVMRRANKRLAYYQMPLERLTELFRELEEQALLERRAR